MYFKGFGSRFTELSAKLDADTLLDFAIHLWQIKTGTRTALGQKKSVFKAWSYVTD
jgi:hypothetical protein